MKNNDKQRLQIIKDFVEGRLGIKEFEVIFKADKQMQAMLSNYHCKILENQCNVSTFDYINTKSWKGAIIQDRVHYVFDWYLFDNFKYKSEYYDYYLKRAQAFESVYPDWLPDEEVERIQENVEDKLPDDMSDTQKKKIIRQTIKESYKYEKRPPRFEQEGVWPLDKEGKPLVFRSQKSDGDLTTYTFYDPKEDKEVEAHELA